MEKFDRIKRELVYKGAIIDFCKETLKLPNGNIVNWDLIDHKGAAAVVPVTDEGKIVLVKQYRPCIERFTLEIPAGGLEPGEDMATAAARELEEEAGYQCEHIELLLNLQTTVAFCNERIGIYLATGLKRTKQKLDEDEFVEFKEYTIDELEQMIFDGIIQDGKTISALLVYKNKYCK